MDLQIGAIENADVKFDGLTVIAGENDTGKSTVGKLVFAVIKAISRYEQDLEVGKEQNTIRAIESLYRELRRSVGNFEEIKHDFLPNSLAKELKPFLVRQSPLDKSEVIKRALTRAFASEFHLEFTPQNTNRKTFLSFTENAYKLFTIKGNNNKITDFSIHDEILPFEDVTFVESGIILQLHDTIARTKTLFEEADTVEKWEYGHGISLHIKDIVRKIGKAKVSIWFNTEKKETKLLKEIEKLIGGKWDYDIQADDFTFSSKNKNAYQNFRTNNTASGIKSFGIIQLLLLAEILNNRSLLIIDEPETHLHPKWQVEYAKIICLLVKHEIPVLLTSHSPYLIQALRHYSQGFGIERFTNYYLAERNDNGLVDIEHVNDDLISQPLQELVWQ